MADNRLYIVDTETNERFVLGKSMSNGWYIKDISFLQQFEDWMNLRDLSASYACDESPTKLISICENDPDFYKYSVLKRMDKNYRASHKG